MTLQDDDLPWVDRAVGLAREALEAGDEPFGSVLVGADGAVLFEDRNRSGSGDETLHPEFAIAKWAANNLSPDERAAATVYTSGEHCPMCSAAHAWVGLGRIVFAASARQIAGWRAEWGLRPGAVAVLPISVVAPSLPTDGPVPEYSDEVRRLLERSARR